MLYIRSNDTLAHHGIKGMEWGVRRYQNYDGSYTKAGLERYNHSKSIYNKKKKERELVDANPESSKYERQLAKANVKMAKKQLEKDYKHLKNDKFADKGKIRYRNGERIRNNNKIYNAAISATTGAALANEILYRNKYYTNEKMHAAIAAGTAVSGTILMAYNIRLRQRNKQISEYYSHTSNY